MRTVNRRRERHRTRGPGADVAQVVRQILYPVAEFRDKIEVGWHAEHAHGYGNGRIPLENDVV